MKSKTPEMTQGLSVRRSYSVKEMHWCVDLMVNSDPWVTLGIGFEKALLTVTNPELERYVGVKNHRLVGFLTLNMAGAFKGYIEDLCVGDKWRNHGIGSLLLDYVEKRVFADQPNVFLCVSSFNEKARSLYLRRGYHCIGELEDYIAPGYSEILMRKTSQSV